MKPNKRKQKGVSDTQLLGVFLALGLGMWITLKIFAPGMAKDFEENQKKEVTIETKLLDTLKNVKPDINYFKDDFGICYMAGRVTPEKLTSITTVPCEKVGL